MEKTNLWRKIGIEAGIILLFIVVSYAYLFPLLEGKELMLHDTQSYRSASKELADFRNATGEEAIWTNAMFGGMPGYMISVVYDSNLFYRAEHWFQKIFHPAAMIILYLIGFYVLLSVLKVNKWLSLAGAFAFGFATYMIIIIGVGHTSKAHALGYLMLVVAGALMAYRSNRWKGALLFAVGLTLEIIAGHPQITYYGLLALFVFGITELIYAVRGKRLAAFLGTTGLLVVAAILALAVNFSYLYSTYRYSKETIRGKSELTHNQENQTSGLDKNYVVQWSQGIDETLTLLIPGFMGGSHTTNPGLESESYKILREKGVENPRQALGSVILYHGDKPFTSGPYYAGAIVVFLFVLGLFVVRGADKWWLLGATLLSILLSWGKYVMPLTSFLLDYLPFYNKFRAPEMTLVIAGFTMPLLGFLGLRDISAGKVGKKELMKGLKWAFGITGGLALLFALLPGIAGSFSAPFDTSYPDWLLQAVISDRQAMLRSTAFRSFIFITLAAGILLLWHLKKIKSSGFYALLALLILTDLWLVDKKYLGEKDFTTKKQTTALFTPSPADAEILKDQDLSFRVLPLQNPWQDARASYFHKNVGGYSAAKLRRYQEMIDHHFSPEIEEMISGLNRQQSPDSVFNRLNTLNMLNTRYILYDLNNRPLVNSAAWGNGWFSPEFRIVANADEEIEALNQIVTKEQVVIDKRFASFVEGKNFAHDSTAMIRLTEYRPNYLKYQTGASSEQLAVFSEIYYADGWKAYVNGKETPHFRANYILRAMVLPEGAHTVEFRFHPTSFYAGNKVSLAGSVLLLLAVAGFFVREFRNKNRINKTGLQEKD
ncbi:MAG TPA: YfhO family protein [Prolixibacteraceae bacterium]|nr:YfhO family protein [Prolixibacteraceae bacterium]NLS99781.1 YfhO family protein [Bacteroidales bacterium]HOY91690.1 YfhO family protein [Prolixibacteraceae bacterium]HPI33930.1 YfhO family protein [Prolixibacteraceae bacterium]HPN76102.1 YfhO family protein [Prolixibacteraceae bacterium]